MDEVLTPEAVPRIQGFLEANTNMELDPTKTTQVHAAQQTPLISITRTREGLDISEVRPSASSCQKQKSNTISVSTSRLHGQGDYKPTGKSELVIKNRKWKRQAREKIFQIEVKGDEVFDVISNNSLRTRFVRGCKRNYNEKVSDPKRFKCHNENKENCQSMAEVGSQLCQKQ